jgi:hypothetical protein
MLFRIGINDPCTFFVLPIIYIYPDGNVFGSNIKIRKGTQVYDLNKMFAYVKAP